MDINVRQLRQKLGLTQEDMAHQLGVTVLTVRRWEKGKNKPSPLALEKIESLIKEAN